MSRVTDYSEQFMRDLAKAADDGLREAAFIASDLASASMPGAGARAIGTVGGRNVYKASRPGSPPGVRNTRLKGSISFARLQPGVWGFGTNVRYGRYLEFGATTKGGQPFFKNKDGEVVYASRKSPHAHRMAKTKPGHIAPRPFIQPVALRKQSVLRTSFQREAAASLARSTTARAIGAARGLNG